MNAPRNQFTTVLVFCLGGAGYLAMLSVDGRERIRVWGRLVSLWRSPPRHGGISDGDRPSGWPRRSPRAGRVGSGSGYPGADRGRPPGQARLDRAGAVRAAAAARPAREQAVFLGAPGIGSNSSGGSSQFLSLPSALTQTVTQLHEGRPSTVLTYTTNASQAQQNNDAEYFRQYVFHLTPWATRGLAGERLCGEHGPDHLDPQPSGLTDTASAQTVTTTVTRAGTSPAQARSRRSCRCPIRPSRSTRHGKWLADPDLMVYSTSDSI